MADRRKVLLYGGLGLVGIGTALWLSQGSAKPGAKPSTPPTAGARPAAFAGWSNDRLLGLILSTSWSTITLQYGPAASTWLQTWYAPYRTAPRATCFAGWTGDQLTNLVYTQTWSSIGGQYGQDCVSWLYNWYAPYRT